MAELSKWIDPLRQGDVAIGEVAGKTLTRVRYCPKEHGSTSFPREGHFFEFLFDDGSIFRVDSRTGFRAQFMRTDNEGDLVGEVTDYGILGGW